MKFVKGTGYSKAEAALSAGLDIDVDGLKNATLAYQKAGHPVGKKEMDAFMKGYLAKSKAVGAYVVLDAFKEDSRQRPYMVVNNPTSGKRSYETVYEVVPAELNIKMFKHEEVVEKINEETQEVTSETKIVETPYQEVVKSCTKTDKETGAKTESTKIVKVPSVKATIEGIAETSSTKKDVAIALMKELVTSEKRDYVIRIVKRVKKDDDASDQNFAAYGKYTPSKSAKVGTCMFFLAQED
jgi:hypothetical protein